MLLIGWVSVCPAVLVSCIFASSLLVCHFDHDDGEGDEDDESNDWSYFSGRYPATQRVRKHIVIKVFQPISDSRLVLLGWGSDCTLFLEFLLRRGHMGILIVPTKSWALQFFMGMLYFSRRGRGEGRPGMWKYWWLLPFGCDQWLSRAVTWNINFQTFWFPLHPI